MQSTSENLQNIATMSLRVVLAKPKLYREVIRSLSRKWVAQKSSRYVSCGNTRTDKLQQQCHFEWFGRSQNCIEKCIVSFVQTIIWKQEFSIRFPRSEYSENNRTDKIESWCHFEWFGRRQNCIEKWFGLCRENGLHKKVLDTFPAETLELTYFIWIAILSNFGETQISPKNQSMDSSYEKLLCLYLKMFG